MSGIARYLESTYIALEDLRFDWTDDEVDVFHRMWRDECSVVDIADALGRDPDEIVVLVIDRARKGKITPRRNGIV